MTTIADIRARLRKDLHNSPYTLRLSKGANYRWVHPLRSIRAPPNFRSTASAMEEITNDHNRRHPRPPA